MGDFVKLGLRAANYVVDNHFDKIPEKHFRKIPDPVFAPREAIRNKVHRGRGKKKGEGDKTRDESSTSGDDRAASRSPRSLDRQGRRRRSVRQDSRGAGSDEDGYRSEGRRGRRDANRERRSSRDDPYYRDRERRPRDSSNPYVPSSVPRRRRSTYTPATAQAAAAGVAAAKYHESLRSSQRQQQQQKQQQQTSYFPSTDEAPRGERAARYDPRYPDPAPNTDPYNPEQYRTESPNLPAPPPSISYASAAYVPYPYPSAAAAAAAFGAERPYEYEPAGVRSADPQSAQDSSRSRSRSRSRHRRRRCHKRPSGNVRRASSTGAAPSSFRDYPDYSQDNYRPSARTTTRPNIRHRASSTSVLDNIKSFANSGASGGARAEDTSRKRDFGLPSKLSSSDRALGASGAGALAGGFLAQELHARLRHSPPSKSSRRRDSHSGNSNNKSAQNNAVALTLLGAVVGGLGANLLAGKEERKKSVAERGSARAWMDDVRGQKSEAMTGWKNDKAGGEGKERKRRRPMKVGNSDDKDDNGDGYGGGGGGGGEGEGGGGWFDGLIPDGLDF